MRKQNRRNQVANDSIQKTSTKRRKKLNDEQIQAQIDKSIEIVNEYARKNEEMRKIRMDSTSQRIRSERISDALTAMQKFKIVMIILFFAIFIYAFIKYSTILGINMNKQVNILDEVKISVITTSEDVYEEYNNELLVYSNQVLRTYDKKGKITWEYTLPEKFSPKLYVKDNSLVVSNNANGTIYFFKNKKEVYNKKIDGKIENVFINKNSSIAVEYSTSGYKKIVGIFSTKGDHLYNIYLSSNSILSMTTIGNSNKLLIISTNTSSFKTGIEISMVDMDAENATKENIINIDNALVYDYRIKSNKLILLLNDSIVELDLSNKTKKVIKEFNSNQMLYISLGDNYYSSVEKITSDKKEEYKKLSYNYKNKVIGEVEIKAAPKIYEVDGVINYIVYQDSIEIYNKWGINIKQIEIEYPPKSIVPFRDGKSLALVYTNKVYVINL